MIDLLVRLQHVARGLLERCDVQSDERVFVLTDDGTDAWLRTAVMDAAAARGATVVDVNAGVRERAFADLPPDVLGALLIPGLVVDITATPWLYSDSFSTYLAAAKTAGSRLALVWGDDNVIPTLAASPVDVDLMARAESLVSRLTRGASLRATSQSGEVFAVKLAAGAAFIGSPPVKAGDVSAPLYASVTVPFAAESARGTLVWGGAGRFQGPLASPFFAREPIRIAVDSGRVTGIEGDNDAAERLRAWFASAPTDDVWRLMDCNIGVDPRGIRENADNMVVHCAHGGLMIGIGSPYEARRDGSHRPGFHLDLLFSDLDVDIDNAPLIRGGGLVD